MITKQEASDLIGATAYDRAGGEIGEVAAVYLDKASGQPEWLTVTTGLFGPRQTFVPSASARLRGPHEVEFGIDKDAITAAPNIDPDGELTEAQEAELFQHYGQWRRPAGLDKAGGPAEGPDGEWMTRSEEQIHVGIATEQTGKVRLRKHVVTENVHQTVPVSHEEVRVEREPITEANRGAAMSGPEISEAEQEVILHEERLVVAKETVPVERVRLATERVTEEQTVDGEIRKERIETEGDTGTVQ
jgi:uncharacterized protein (TIGR02271 family)